MMNDGLMIKGVSKSFNGFFAVKEVTAIFLPGRISALIGPNGAGKTTLFHLITGELKPDKGKIIYKGDDITGLPPWKIAKKKIGRLFQDVRIFKNMTVLENVVCSLSSSKEESLFFSFYPKKRRVMDIAFEKAKDLLRLVGLRKEENRRAGELSFGQQKLLAIARLLALGAQVLLLDEPTAGLSVSMRERLLELLKRIVAEDNKKIIVVVEHNMSVVLNIAHWVYFMNEGKISFFGRADHVLGAKEVRELYLGLSA